MSKDVTITARLTDKQVKTLLKISKTMIDEKNISWAIRHLIKDWEKENKKCKD